MATAPYSLSRVPSATYQAEEEKKRKVLDAVATRISLFRPQRVPSVSPPEPVGEQSGFDAGMALNSFVPTRVPSRQAVPPAPVAAAQPIAQQHTAPPSVSVSPGFTPAPSSVPVETRPDPQMSRTAKQAAQGDVLAFTPTRAPSKQPTPQAGFDAAMQNRQPDDSQIPPQAGFDAGMALDSFVPTRVPSRDPEPATVANPDDRATSFTPTRVPSTSANQQEPTRTMHEDAGHSRWKDGLLAFLEGLAKPQQSTGDPRQDLFNRLGAGAGGFGVGVVNPQAVHDFRYRKDLAKFQQEEARRLELAQKETAQRKAVSDITGRDPKTGRPTLTAERIAQQLDAAAARISQGEARIAQGDERIRQGDERFNQSEAKRVTAEKNAHIGQLLAAGRIPGRKFSPESQAELQNLLGVTLPDDFNPMTHDVKVGTDGSYQVISIDKQTGKPTTQPVTTPGGQALTQPPRNTQTRKPYFYYEGQARTELQKDLGIKDPSALVDNPRFQEAVEREIEADRQASASRGLAPSSRSQIERRVEQRLKVKRQIRAGDAITPEMVKQKAAEIYNRESSGTGAPKTKAPAAPPASRKQQMEADEKEYQKLYPSLSPADRKALEDAYKRDHGRPPRKSQGAANLSPERGAQVRDVPARFEMRRNRGNLPLDHPGEVLSDLAPIPPATPFDPESLEGFGERFERDKRDELNKDYRAEMNLVQLADSGQVRNGSFETRAYVPKSMRGEFKDWLAGTTGNLMFRFLRTHAGWTNKTFRRWEKLHNNGVFDGREDAPAVLPELNIRASKINKKGIVKLRVAPEVLRQMKEFGRIHTSKKFDESSPKA